MRIAPILGAAFLCVVLACIWNTGCSNFYSYGLNVTNGPRVPPQTSFTVNGTPNTPFTAIISDTQSSWPITGVIPLGIYMINEQTPVRIIATKAVNSNALMSLQILAATTTFDFVSTTQPFGTISVELGAGLTQFAPPAGANAPSRDVRFFVKGPIGTLFTALIEDESVAYQTQAVAPALFLFPNSHGTVDGLFTQVFAGGTFDIDLIVNGHRVANGTGGPTVTVK